MTDKTVLRRRRTRGGVLAWLLIFILLVGACVVVAGVFIAHNIRVHETRAGNDVQVDTPFGSVHVQHNGNGKPETAGMPLYPGAKPLRGGESATVDLSAFFGDKDLQIIAGKWETSDPIDKVQKFYEDKFPDMSVIHHGNKIEMHSIKGHGKRVIALLDKGSTTEIALASVGEPKAN